MKPFLSEIAVSASNGLRSSRLRIAVRGTISSWPERSLRSLPHACGLPPDPGPPATLPTPGTAHRWFDPLELTVIRLARLDDRRSLRADSRWTRLIGFLFGARRTNRLADARLEVLRRVAVVAWRQGYRIAPHAMTELVTAGFTICQFEALLMIATYRGAR